MRTGSFAILHPHSVAAPNSRTHPMRRRAARRRPVLVRPVRRATPHPLRVLTLKHYLVHCTTNSHKESNHIFAKAIYDILVHWFRSKLGACRLTSCKWWQRCVDKINVNGMLRVRWVLCCAYREPLPPTLGGAEPAIGDNATSPRACRGLLTDVE